MSEDTFQKRAPDYKLKARVRKTKRGSGRIGCGWKTHAGAGAAISVRLDPGVVLSWSDDLEITLFPYGDDTKEET